MACPPQPRVDTCHSSRLARNAQPQTRNGPACGYRQRFAKLGINRAASSYLVLRGAPTRRTRVIVVETRALEHDCANPCHYLPQCVFPALRARDQGGGCHRLVRIKMVTAIVTTVTVGRHVLPFRAGGRAEGRPAQAVRRIILARDTCPRGSRPRARLAYGAPRAARRKLHRGSAVRAPSAGENVRPGPPRFRGGERNAPARPSHRGGEVYARILRAISGRRPGWRYRAA